MASILMYIFTFVATLLATFLGALLGIKAKKLNKNITSFLQNFSIGSIIGILFFEIIVEAVEDLSNLIENNKVLSLLITIAIILVSGLIFFFLHEATHHLTHHHEHDDDDNKACEDHGHTSELFTENRSILYSTLIFLVAITIHNIPEGLSLGLSFDSSEAFPLNGTLFAVALFIHNFFIGFSMCISFKHAHKNNKFSILMTALSSLPSFILAIVGFYLGNYNNTILNGIIYAISSGTLLYVLIIELLPQVFYTYKHKYTFLFIILGILLSLFLVMI